MKSILKAIILVSSCIRVSCFITSPTKNLNSYRVVQPSGPPQFIYNKRISTIKAVEKEIQKNNALSDEKVTSSLGLLLFSQFLLFIGVGAVIPSIPLYGKELGFSGAANGIVISAPAVALLLLAKFGGNFADKKRKPAMIIGMAIIAISDLGTALCQNLPSLVVARLGLGAGRCISEAGERGLLADLASEIPEFRGRALAAQQAVIALGIAIGAPLGGFVVEEYGPRASFLCVAGAAAIACLLYLPLPETVTDESLSLEPSDSDNVVDWTDLLSRNQWRGICLCQSGCSFGFAAKIASIPILAASTLPGGAIGAGALLSAAGLSGLVGAPLGGIVVDRSGAKAAIVLSGIVAALSLILVPIALSPVALSFTDWDNNFSLKFGDTLLQGNALPFSIAVILWSTAAAAQGPALIALAQQLAPSGREATALSLPRAAGDGVYIIAPALLGAVTDSFIGVPGIECAVAGTATFLGVLALIILVDGGKI